MKILFDHQTFSLQEYGGISRYFWELIKRCEAFSELECDVALKVTNNAYFDRSKYSGVFPFFPNRQFMGKARLMTLINNINSLQSIKKGGFDIFHPTYYSPYFLKALKRKPFVLTVYDMIHEKFASQFPELNRGINVNESKQALIEKAAVIIAISESTKRDIVDIFGIKEDKIKVIYLGNSFQTLATEDNGINTFMEPYILYVGSRSVYKNYNTLIKAFSTLPVQYMEVNLVCAGGGSFSADELKKISELGLEGRVKQVPIKNDDYLGRLYANAKAFVFPSLYEGFGIPVLEAFACGCPAILSKAGSLPEVGGDAVMYFEPKDVEELRHNIMRLLEEPQTRQEMIEAGNQRLDLFSWEKTYLDTVDLYKTL